MSLKDSLLQAFNEKDLALFGRLFSDDIVGICLANDQIIFSSKTELQRATQDLFKTNPDLKCTINQHYFLDPFLILHIYFSNYVCGATRTTMWTCKIDKGLIKKLWLTH